MKKLSKEQYEKACLFIENEARALDAAFFKYWKGEERAERVVEELKKYQNNDGGFGHSLEPDFRLAESSPMATTIAFQYMNKLGLKKDHPVVKEGINYLLNTYDSENQRWNPVPPTVNDVPHAPWWYVKSGELSYSANPDAEIVGYLLAYSDESEPKSTMLEKVMTHLSNLNEYEIHEVLCYLRLAKMAGGDIEATIVDKIHKQLPYIIDRPEKWDSYGVQPVVLADSEDSPFVDELNQELHVNLDYLVESQKSDGSFEPTWEWGQYEEEWKKAKREWQGVLTVQQIITLSKFGRINA